MQISDGKVGSRELLAVIIFIIAMKATDTTPDLLTQHGMNAAWLLTVISGLVMLLPLLVLLRLLKKYNTGLNDLLRNLTGKWVGSMLIVLLFVVLLGSTFITSRGYIDIVNTLFFPMTPIPILYGLLMLFSLLVANRGFEAIARTSWILFGLTMSVGGLLLILTWRETQWLFLFPIMGSGLPNLLWDGLTHSSIYGEILLIAFFFPYIKSYGNFRSGTLAGYGLSAFLLALFNAWYVVIFDYPSIKNVAYPYQQVTRVAAFGMSPAHLEALFLCIWIMAAVLHFAIYLYLIAYMFARLFNIHEFEPLIIPFAGLILFLGSFPHNIIEMNLLRDSLIMGTSWLFIVLPFLLWMLDYWKGRTK